MLLNAQDTLYVDVTATGSNNGSNWTNAYNSILDGMENALAGDQIWVADGTYYLHQGGGTGDTTLWLKSNVHMYGGFAGGETDLNSRNPSTNQTIIDGYNVGLTHQVGHVVIADQVTNCIVDGFVIQNGRARPTSIFIDEAACDAADHGVGGTSAEAVLVCAGGTNGGGVLINQSDPTFRNCTIQNNSAGKGAGVYIMVATATGSGSYAAPLFEDCTIQNNTATARGGGVSMDLYTNPTFVRCHIVNNTCDDKGGGLYLDWNCDPTLINCLIAGNTAIRGAGMGIDGTSEPVLLHSTVTNNYALDLGAGLYTGSYNVRVASPNTPYLINSIVWGNRTAWGGAKDLAIWHENHFHIENSIVGSGFRATSASAITNTDPLLVDTSNGNYFLDPSSPAIDAGVSTSALIPTLTVPNNDLSDSTRDASPDIGAYELSSTTLPVELLTFNASLTEHNDVDIEWSTVLEVNADHFELLKSANGLTWEMLSRVPATGWSFDYKEYAYLDVQPMNGYNYYRLRIVDKDGKTEYSDIKKVFLPTGINEGIYPNPVNIGELLYFELGQVDKITLRNISGQLVWENKVENDNVEVPRLSPGLYYCSLHVGDIEQTYKLVVE